MIGNLPNKPNDRRGVTPPVNRAYQTRRDDDDFVTPSITIYDIDYAILFHLQNTLSLEVIDNGEVTKVPVMYGGSEKWHQIKKYGFLRDKSNKPIIPLVVLHRTAINKDDRIHQLDVWPDRQTAMLPMGIRLLPRRRIRPEVSQFSKIYNAKKPLEFYMMLLPSFVFVQYSVVLWTEYTEQMNQLVQIIEPTDGFAWGDSWQFPTRISDFSFETVTGDSEDRIVRCSLTLDVQGYLLSEFRMKMSTIQKVTSIKRVLFEDERGEFAGNVEDLPEDMYPTNDILYEHYRDILYGIEK